MLLDKDFIQPKSQNPQAIGRLDGVSFTRQEYQYLLDRDPMKYKIIKAWVDERLMPYTKRKKPNIKAHLYKLKGCAEEDLAFYVGTEDIKYAMMENNIPFHDYGHGEKAYCYNVTNAFINMYATYVRIPFGPESDRSFDGAFADYIGSCFAKGFEDFKKEYWDFKHGRTNMTEFLKSISFVEEPPAHGLSYKTLENLMKTYEGSDVFQQDAQTELTGVIRAEWLKENEAINPRTHIRKVKELYLSLVKDKEYIDSLPTKKLTLNHAVLRIMHQDYIENCVSQGICALGFYPWDERRVKNGSRDTKLCPNCEKTVAWDIDTCPECGGPV